MKSRLLPLALLLFLALAGGLGMPIASYMTGKRVIGPYEGKLGLSDYLGSIYDAAGRGEFLAWWLLLSPALVAGVWYLVLRPGRGRAAGDDQ